MAESPTIMVCTEHGETPWEGHIKCKSCGRLYQPPWQAIVDQPEEARLPEAGHPFCDCTAVLLPHDMEATPFNHDGGSGYSAVAVCAACFITHYPRHADSGDGPAPPRETH